MSNLDEPNESPNEQQNVPLNELGRGVTRLARSGPKRETAVISVRLETNDIARLEGIGHETGKTVSQVIRDAIVAYRVIRPAMTVGLWRRVDRDCRRTRRSQPQSRLGCKLL